MFNFLTRVLIRRRSWGDSEQAQAARARRVFGSALPYAWLSSIGVHVRSVQIDGVHGEWIEPTESKRTNPECIILYIHGGGYVSCSPGTHRPITASLARRTRMRVLSIAYRLAPEHKFPAGLDDVVRAYTWLVSQNPASRIAIVGDSAGGGMVLALLQRARDEQLRMPNCAVCFSPLADLSASGESMQFNNGRDHMFRRENTRSFAKMYVGNGSRTAPLVSMINANASGWPPMLFQVSDTELLLDDARRMHQLVLSAGGDSTLTVYHDLLHCWQMLVGIVPEAGAAMTEASAFITRRLATDI